MNLYILSDDEQIQDKKMYVCVYLIVCECVCVCLFKCMDLWKQLYVSCPCWNILINKHTTPLLVLFQTGRNDIFSMRQGDMGTLWLK